MNPKESGSRTRQEGQTLGWCDVLKRQKDMRSEAVTSMHPNWLVMVESASSLPPVDEGEVLFNLEFRDRGSFEDIIRFHRFAYYVLNVPLWSDQLYDKAEALLKKLHPLSLVTMTVGSSNPGDYPAYIREGRRPNSLERAERDVLTAPDSDVLL